MQKLSISKKETYEKLKKLGDICVGEGLVSPVEPIPKGVKTLLENAIPKSLAHSVVNRFKDENGNEKIAVYMLGEEDLGITEDSYFNCIFEDGPPCRIYNLTKDSIE